MEKGFFTAPKQQVFIRSYPNKDICWWSCVWMYHQWSTYLFVSSWIGLPVALHLPEGQVGAVGQAAEEGSWRPIWKRLVWLLFHAGILTATNLQRTSLQIIVQLQSINC